MIVTAVESLSGTRSKVFLDGSPAFVLYKGELRRYGIREGQELSAEDWQELTQTLLPKRAKLRCMNLLKERSYTEHQLQTKLRQGGYPEEIIREALDYVKSYGYVDDLQFAQDYIANQQEKKSRRRIEEDLMRRGIDRTVLQEAFACRQEAGEVPDEVALARRFMEKKHYCAAAADAKERQKMAAFLYRKGIGMDAIREAFSLEMDE